jgi:hypothetical protein
MATPGKRLYQRAREKKPGVAKYPLVTRKAGILVAMALELPGSIVGGLVIGYLLDQIFQDFSLAHDGVDDSRLYGRMRKTSAVGQVLFR